MHHRVVVIIDIIGVGQNDRLECRVDEARGTQTVGRTRSNSIGVAAAQTDVGR